MGSPGSATAAGTEVAVEPGRVIKPWASRLAWSLWAIVLMGLFSLVILSRLLLPGVLTPDDVYVVGAFSAFVLAFSTVGALVASRHPRNPIGWLMCGAAIAYTAGGMTGNYAEYAFGGPAVSLPAARFVAWISTWVWGLGAGLPFLVLLLFPTGRHPRRAGGRSSGSQPVGWCCWRRAPRWRPGRSPTTRSTTRLAYRVPVASFDCSPRPAASPSWVGALRRPVRSWSGFGGLEETSDSSSSGWPMRSLWLL